MKKTIAIELSPKSVEKAKKALQDFEENYRNGIKNAVQVATEELYKRVIKNCNSVNLAEFTDAIQWDYDRLKNEGRVWVKSSGRGSSGLVIILNEFGTGAVKEENGGHYAYDYAEKHNYTINESGKGETGWAFPTKDGTMKWTHGISSKLMFFDAFNSIKEDFKDIVHIELEGSIGKMY